MLERITPDNRGRGGFGRQLYPRLHPLLKRITRLAEAYYDFARQYEPGKRRRFSYYTPTAYCAMKLWRLIMYAQVRFSLLYHPPSLLDGCQKFRKLKDARPVVIATGYIKSRAPPQINSNLEQLSSGERSKELGPMMCSTFFNYTIKKIKKETTIRVKLMVIVLL